MAKSIHRPIGHRPIGHRPSGHRPLVDPLSFLEDSFTVQGTREEALKNINLIIRIRWFISPSIYVIMVIASIFGFSEQPSFSENQLIVNSINLVVILILNLVYYFLVRKVGKLEPLVLFQLFIDVVHFSLTVYKTGGVTSPFAFLYFMVIFSASILVSGTATYLVAGVSSSLYSLIIVLELLNVVPHQDFFSPLSGLQQNYSFLILSWSFAIFSFFAFAALASYLTGLIRSRQNRLRVANSTLAKKVQTLLLLYRTSKALNTYTTVRDVVEYILSELIDFLKVDRALLYLNIRDEYLHLYMVKERVRDALVSTYEDTRPERAKPSGEMREKPHSGKLEGINIDIPMREKAGLTARAALRHEAFNIRKPEDSPYINRELAKKIGMNPFALAPLTIRDVTVGVIGIDRSFEDGYITEEEFQILQMFANQAAITIGSLEGVDREFLRAYGL